MYMPQVYPKAISFYQSTNFAGERAAINHPTWDTDDIHLFGADAQTRKRALSQLEVVTFRRSGVLRGEYVVILCGFLALDRNGVPIKIGSDDDDDWVHKSAHHQVEDFCGTPAFEEKRDFVLRNWNKIQKIDATTVLFELHAAHNYYHFITQFLPKIRHFDDSPRTTIAVAQDVLSVPFQRELLLKTLGSRKLAVFGNTIRIESPFLVYEPFSKAGLHWMRDRIGLRARRGERRIYIERKSSQSGRETGRIVESEGFSRFLAAHGFERVDFGAGEVPVSEQIKSLDGAGIILSAHGANLTNIGFLEEGVNIIEVLPHCWFYFSTMQIALAASLNYFGIICTWLDDNKNMIIDMNDLKMAFDRASLGLTRASASPERAVVARHPRDEAIHGL